MQQEILQTLGRNHRMQKKNKKSINNESFLHQVQDSSSTHKKKSSKLLKPTK